MNKLVRRRWLKLIRLLAFLASIPPILFVVNGLLLSAGENPIQGVTGHPPTQPTSTIKVLAYNIAKGMAHLGGTSFDSAENVRARLRQMAQLIRDEQPDFVFLSEALFECTPCPVNQVTFLADATAMHSWVTGENYNWGLPFYRIVGGNAILSRLPLEAEANHSLAGRKPFYATKNSRRVLFASVEGAGGSLLLACVHNDSYDPENNLKQTREILDWIGDRSAIIAGDFNAAPGEPSISLVEASGRFAKLPAGLPTFPTDDPKQRIDLIFAPAAWRLVKEYVPPCQASDHLSVVAVFRLPGVP